MANKGRPPIPTELKRLRGTLRPGRLPANAPLVALVEPVQAPGEPQGLSDGGLAFWEAAWGCNWISQNSDYFLVLMTSEGLSERDSLRALLEIDPGNYRARSGLRELERQIVSNLALLGFTPSDRARLGLAEVKKESKLEEIIRRREARDRAREAERAALVNNL